MGHAITVGVLEHCGETSVCLFASLCEQREQYKKFPWCPLQTIPHVVDLDISTSPVRVQGGQEVALAAGVPGRGRRPPDAALHGAGDVRGRAGRLQPRLEDRPRRERADQGRGGPVGYLPGTALLCAELLQC